MRVKGPSWRLLYSPDVMLVCENYPHDYKATPCVIVEVFSSTNRSDKNEKRHAYLGLALQLYLIGYSRRRYILDHYRTTSWQGRRFIDKEAVSVPCAETESTAEDVYMQTPYPKNRNRRPASGMSFRGL